MMITAGQVKTRPVENARNIFGEDSINQSNIASQQYYNRCWQGGPQGNKKPITDALKNNEWHGRRCFIIGGGPSVLDYDFWTLNDFLKGEKAIGINRAFQWFPAIIINLASDYEFYKQLTFQPELLESQQYRDYKGIKVWVDHINNNLNDCYYVRSVGRNGISFRLEGIYSHSTTAYSAINIALALGASPIYLLGYDLCKDKEGRTHFHHYPTSPSYERSWKVFLEAFEGMKKYIDKSGRGNQIINLSPITKLEAFPTGSLLELESIKRGAS